MFGDVRFTRQRIHFRGFKAKDKTDSGDVRAAEQTEKDIQFYCVLHPSQSSDSPTKHS